MKYYSFVGCSHSNLTISTSAARGPFDSWNMVGQRTCRTNHLIFHFLLSPILCFSHFPVFCYPFPASITQVHPPFSAAHQSMFHNSALWNCTAKLVRPDFVLKNEHRSPLLVFSLHFMTSSLRSPSSAAHFISSIQRLERSVLLFWCSNCWICRHFLWIHYFRQFTMISKLSGFQFIFAKWECYSYLRIRQNQLLFGMWMARFWWSCQQIRWRDGSLWYFELL